MLGHVIKYLLLLQVLKHELNLFTIGSSTKS